MYKQVYTEQNRFKYEIEILENTKKFYHNLETGNIIWLIGSPL